MVKVELALAKMWEAALNPQRKPVLTVAIQLLTAITIRITILQEVAVLPTTVQLTQTSFVPFVFMDRKNAMMTHRRVIFSRIMYIFEKYHSLLCQQLALSSMY